MDKDVDEDVDEDERQDLYSELEYRTLREGKRSIEERKQALYTENFLRPRTPPKHLEAN